MDDRQFKPEYRRICATIYNSAVIDKDGDIYVNGIGSSYITANKEFVPKYMPSLVDIK